MVTHRLSAGKVVGRASDVVAGVIGEMHLAMVARRGVTEPKVREWIKKLRSAADALEELTECY